MSEYNWRMEKGCKVINYWEGTWGLWSEDKVLFLNLFAVGWMCSFYDSGNSNNSSSFLKFKEIDWMFKSNLTSRAHRVLLLAHKTFVSQCLVINGPILTIILQKKALIIYK